MSRFGIACICIKWTLVFALSIIISGCVEDPTRDWKPAEILIGEQVLTPAMVRGGK